MILTNNSEISDGVYWLIQYRHPTQRSEEVQWWWLGLPEITPNLESDPNITSVIWYMIYSDLLQALDQMAWYLGRIEATHFRIISIDSKFVSKFNHPDMSSVLRNSPYQVHNEFSVVELLSLDRRKAVIESIYQ